MEIHEKSTNSLKIRYEYSKFEVVHLLEADSSLTIFRNTVSSDG
jgi:hypothetical protein